MHPRRSYSRWRLLIAAPRVGAENMARDTALQARAARTGETVFSIYSWSRPTLSFGRNQPAFGLYDLGKIGAGGIDVTLAKDDGQMYRVAVRDSGPGIPEDQRAAIFQPFEQLASSTSARLPGIGLGLALPLLVFSLIPGAMLVLTVLSVNVVGDGVRDALDPRAQVRVRN